MEQGNIRLGPAAPQVLAPAGTRYRAETLSRAEADALIAACSATSRTGIRQPGSRHLVCATARRRRHLRLATTRRRRHLRLAIDPETT